MIVVMVFIVIVMMVSVTALVIVVIIVIVMMLVLMLKLFQKSILKSCDRLKSIEYVLTRKLIPRGCDDLGVFIVLSYHRNDFFKLFIGQILTS